MRTRGGGGKKIPKFCGRHIWMAPDDLISNWIAPLRREARHGDGMDRVVVVRVGGGLVGGRGGGGDEAAVVGAAAVRKVFPVDSGRASISCTHSKRKCRTYWILWQRIDLPNHGGLWLVWRVGATLKRYLGSKCASVTRSIRNTYKKHSLEFWKFKKRLIVYQEGLRNSETNFEHVLLFYWMARTGPFSWSPILTIQSVSTSLSVILQYCSVIG